MASPDGPISPTSAFARDDTAEPLSPITYPYGTPPGVGTLYPRDSRGMLARLPRINTTIAVQQDQSLVANEGTSQSTCANIEYVQNQILHLLQARLPYLWTPELRIPIRRAVSSFTGSVSELLETAQHIGMEDDQATPRLHDLHRAGYRTDDPEEVPHSPDSAPQTPPLQTSPQDQITTDGIARTP